MKSYAEEFPWALRPRSVLREFSAALGECNETKARFEAEPASADAAETFERATRRLGLLLIEARRLKDEWIDVARRRFVPSPRENCCVCGKFKVVTHAHHVVPLSAQYDRGFEAPDHEHVWLCPAHHAIIHVLIVDRKDDFERGRIAAEVLTDLNGRDEYHAVLRLLGMADRAS